jgi:hypothetical protein
VTADPPRGAPRGRAGRGHFLVYSRGARGRQVWRSVAVGSFFFFFRAKAVGSFMDRLGRCRPARVAAGTKQAFDLQGPNEN